MTTDTLFPDVALPLRRFEVTVTLPRDERDDALVPEGTQALAELAAAALSADGLVTAWTSHSAVLSMILEVPCAASALARGVAVVRALGGGGCGASVSAEIASP